MAVGKKAEVAVGPGCEKGWARDVLGIDFYRYLQYT